MTVYVDDAAIAATVGKHKSRWSHLTADRHEELVSFAVKIGLNPVWIQHEGNPLEHFDVTTSKRAAALKKGAVPITSREGGYQAHAKAKGEAFDLEAVRAFRETLEPAAS
jgi:hypothetical protein